MPVTVSALKTADSIQATVSAALAEAMIVETMLKNVGVFGSVTFTLPDKTTIPCAIAMELGNITGPWQTGPIKVDVQGSTATLANMILGDVDVADLMAYGASGPGQSVAVDKTLKQGEHQDVQLPDGAGSNLFPVYNLKPGDVARLTEIRSFIEDIHCNVIFVNLVNYANHGLQTLGIEARIKDVQETYPVSIEERKAASVDMVLPLTNYLGNRTLQFQVTKTRTDGSTTMTPWLDWDLDALGNIISLGWDQISTDFS